MSAENWTSRLMGGLAKTTERLAGNLPASPAADG
jgi:fused signal recognition particle receptor